MKVNKGIFQGDRLSPLLFVLALIPLSLVLGDEKAGYALRERKRRVSHLLFINDLKLCAQNANQLETLVITVQVFNSQGIGMEFGIRKCVVLGMKKEKYEYSEGIHLPSEDEI